MNFRKDINGLRAVAVALVLLFHLQVPLFSAGYLGVDVFFVISGFLMTRIIFGNIDRKTFSLLNFYRDRFFRIFPALGAMVFCILLFGVFSLDPITLSTAARHGFGSLLFISNIQYWREFGYFAEESKTNWFLHTWSLGVEWWFYILYPAVIVVLKPLVRLQRTRLLMLGGALLLSLALSAASDLAPSNRAHAFGFFMLPPRAWEMLAGGLIALRPDWLTGRGARQRLMVERLGLGLIALSVFLLGDAIKWPTALEAIPVVGACLILAAQAPGTVLGSGALQSIGAASYSIYLWHWPLIVGLNYFDLKSWPYAFGALVASLMLGGLSYRWVERPAQAWLKTGKGQGYRLSVGLALATALTVGAIVIVLAAGLPARIKGDPTLYADAVAASGDNAPSDKGCGGLSPLDGTLKPCMVGISRPGHDVVVIGDSFAEMWFARAHLLAPSLQDHAVVLLTQRGCPPISGVERLLAGSVCARFHDAAIKEMRRARYGSVLYASMWTTYFRRDKPLVNIDGPTAIRRLAVEVADLNSRGKHVAVLGTTPYPAFDVPRELRLAAFKGKSTLANRDFDFDQVSTKSYAMDRDLKALQGVEFIDPTVYLCDGSTCPLVRDGRSLYSDPAHLRYSSAGEHGQFLDAWLLAKAGVAASKADNGVRRAMGEEHVIPIS